MNDPSVLALSLIKGEFYFENDELLEGGQKGIMSNDTTYTEVINPAIAVTTSFCSLGHFFS